jgi:hypothetical protein
MNGKSDVRSRPQYTKKKKNELAGSEPVAVQTAISLKGGCL